MNANSIKQLGLLFFIALCCCLSSGKAEDRTQITYTISFPKAKEHYAEIEMDITGLNQPQLVLKMLVWPPESYLIQEYVKNVELITATSNSKKLSVTRAHKNMWNVNTSNISILKIKYRVYTFEQIVRNSFIDHSHAYLSAAGIFLYSTGMFHQASTIHIKPGKDWTNISSSLNPMNDDPFTLYAPDYDILFDSLIEVGNQNIFSFKTMGIKHNAVISGGSKRKTLNL
jgi:predicted metalloprotease with PDZ domain